jgi:hypothetical protein
MSCWDTAIFVGAFLLAAKRSMSTFHSRAGGWLTDRKSRNTMRAIYFLLMKKASANGILYKHHRKGTCSEKRTVAKKNRGSSKKEPADIVVKNGKIVMCLHMKSYMDSLNDCISR